MSCLILGLLMSGILNAWLNALDCEAAVAQPVAGQ